MKVKKNIFNILLLGGTKRIGLAKEFIKAAKKKRLITKIYTYEKNIHIPVDKHIVKIKGQNWNSKDILKDVKNKINRLNIKLVVANTDPAINILSKLRYLKSCSLVSDYQVVKNSCDKKKINILLQKQKVKTTGSLKGYPMILKPRFGANSKLIFISNDKKTIKKFSNKSYICEKFIKGKEYSVDCYISPKSGIIGIVPRVRNEITGGEATLTTTEDNKTIKVISKKIIKIMKFIGPINLQFIFYRKNYYFMEANPRMSGGVLAAIKAGLNIPNLMINDVLDINQKKIKKIKKVIMHKYFFELYENNN
jgi:carbamoyl-phosphate synthase large subunit